MRLESIEWLIVTREDFQLKIQMLNEIFGEDCMEARLVEIDLNDVERKIERHFLNEVYRL